MLWQPALHVIIFHLAMSQARQEASCIVTFIVTQSSRLLSIHFFSNLPLWQCLCIKAMKKPMSKSVILHKVTCPKYISLQVCDTFDNILINRQLLRYVLILSMMPSCYSTDQNITYCLMSKLEKTTYDQQTFLHY